MPESILLLGGYYWVVMTARMHPGRIRGGVNFDTQAGLFDGDLDDVD